MYWVGKTRRYTGVHCTKASATAATVATRRRISPAVQSAFFSLDTSIVVLTLKFDKFVFYTTYLSGTVYDVRFASGSPFERTTKMSEGRGPVYFCVEFS